MPASIPLNPYNEQLPMKPPQVVATVSVKNNTMSLRDIFSPHFVTTATVPQNQPTKRPLSSNNLNRGNTFGPSHAARMQAFRMID